MQIHRRNGAYQNTPFRDLNISIPYIFDGAVEPKQRYNLMWNTTILAVHMQWCSTHQLRTEF